MVTAVIPNVSRNLARIKEDKLHPSLSLHSQTVVLKVWFVKECLPMKIMMYARVSKIYR